MASLDPINSAVQTIHETHQSKMAEEGGKRFAFVVFLGDRTISIEYVPETRTNHTINKAVTITGISDEISPEECDAIHKGLKALGMDINKLEVSSDQGTKTYSGGKRNRTRTRRKPPPS